VRAMRPDRRRRLSTSSRDARTNGTNVTKPSSPSFLLTVDADWIPRSAVGYERLLDFAAERGLTLTTFFTTGFLREAPDLVERTVREGHEIGSHGCCHGVDTTEKFDSLSYRDQVLLLDRSRRLLEKHTGEPVRAFRAPDLLYNDDTLRALGELGFYIDSSAPALRFDRLLSASDRPLKRILTTPRTSVLIPAREREVDWPLVEVPPSAAGVPVIMSVLRRFGMGPLRPAARLAGLLSGVVNFYCHPWEFVDASERYVPVPENSNWSVDCSPENLAGLETFCRYVTERLGFPSRSLTEHVRLCGM